MLEPYAEKFARAVLKEERGREAPDLPGGAREFFYFLLFLEILLVLPIILKHEADKYSVRYECSCCRSEIQEWCII